MRAFFADILAPKKFQTENTALQFLAPKFCTKNARVKR